MAYNGYKLRQYSRLLLDKDYLRMMPWQRPTLILKIAENLLYLLVWLLLVMYLYNHSAIKINGLVILVPAIVACILNCFCVKYEETPCNATVQLLSKIILVLRLLICFSVLIKLNSKTEWDWSTTFWPYWCSFAIQGIMAIASFIIFLNTLLNHWKEEATISDSKYSYTHTHTHQ